MSDIPSSSNGQRDFVYVKKKGGTILLRSGHQYYARRKHNSGLTIWACTQRKICKGILRIKEERILEETAHSPSCTPDCAENQVLESFDNLREKITSPQCPAVPTVYNTTVAELKDSGMDIVTKIPDFQSIKSTLYRQRNATAKVSKMKCKDVQEVEVPDAYKKFLLADFSEGSRRILIFSSMEARQIMCEVTDFYGDGTFKSCPAPFAEIYAIHGDTGSTANQTNIMPLVYALLSDRTTSTYVYLFRVIKSRLPNWNPIKFKVDYEKATMKAISIVFPSTTVKGCYFHYNKAVFKKGRDMDQCNQKKRRLVGLCAVLPLLPEEKVMEGWAYIYQRYAMSSDDLEIKNFVMYMEKQWLIDDFFKVWCVYGETHRTTNFLEGWHNKLNRAIGRKGPNLLQLLHALKEDSSLYAVRHLKAQHNEAAKRKRARITVFKDEFIQEAQLELIEGNVTVGHFLEIVRH